MKHFTVTPTDNIYNKEASELEAILNTSENKQLYCNMLSNLMKDYIYNGVKEPIMTKTQYYFGVDKEELDKVTLDNILSTGDTAEFYLTRMRYMRNLRTALLNDPDWASNTRIEDISRHIKKWEDISNDK